MQADDVVLRIVVSKGSVTGVRLRRVRGASIFRGLFKQGGPSNEREERGPPYGSARFRNAFDFFAGA